METRLYQAPGASAEEEDSRSEPVARIELLPGPEEYPSTDGKPMADRDAHARTMNYAYDALRQRFE